MANTDTQASSTTTLAQVPEAAAPASRMANAIRALAMDAVQQANSGHPGAPMGMADMAVALWGQHLKHNPRNPGWFDRDRFVLSNGHGSMLLYALLHLTGYDLPIGELKNFRQLHSKTAGHPEHGITPGVETTTGPLGQGITNAVGMALAEKLLAAEFNRPNFPVVDHRTYVFLGDGCLMEGISHEAVALAGAWKLDKLVALYDDNGISIDGKVAPWFIDNTALRFVASGWQVLGPVDGQDAAAVAAAIAEAKTSSGKPTLIICKTAIGQGSPNRAGTAKAHGEPLGAEEIKLTREALGWDSAPRTSTPPGTPRPRAWPPRRTGTCCSPATRRPTRAWPPSWCAACRASCPPASARPPRASPPKPMTRPPPWPAARPASWRWKA
jgi:transketolase